MYHATALSGQRASRTPHSQRPGSSQRAAGTPRSKPGLLLLSTRDTGGPVTSGAGAVLCTVGCLGHPWPLPLNARGSPAPVMTTKNVPRLGPVFPEGQNHPSFTTRGLTEANLMKWVFREASTGRGTLQGMERHPVPETEGGRHHPKSQRGKRGNSITAAGHVWFRGREADRRRGRGETQPPPRSRKNGGGGVGGTSACAPLSSRPSVSPGLLLG